MYEAGRQRSRRASRQTPASGSEERIYRGGGSRPGDQVRTATNPETPAQTGRAGGATECPTRARRNRHAPIDRGRGCSCHRQASEFNPGPCSPHASTIRPRPVPLVLVTGPHATTPPCPLEARQTQSYRVPTPPTIRTRPTAPVPTALRTNARQLLDARRSVRPLPLWAQ